jgi:hypothetical protein
MGQRPTPRCGLKAERPRLARSDPRPKRPGWPMATGARSRRSHRARARCDGAGFDGEPIDNVSVHRLSGHEGNVGSSPGKLAVAGTNRAGGASTRWHFSMVEDRRWALVSGERSCNLRE